MTVATAAVGIKPAWTQKAISRVVSADMPSAIPRALAIMPAKAEPRAKPAVWIVGMADPAKSPSSAAAPCRIAPDTKAQQAPIPAPDKNTAAMTSQSGPAGTKAASPISPSAVMAGPLMMAAAVRDDAKLAVNRAAAVHDTDSKAMM